MGTVISIGVVVSTSTSETAIAAALHSAFGWFSEVERRCSRFDRDSELNRLCERQGSWTPVSSVLFEALTFACQVAERSGGAFDPTVGAAMMARGYHRHYLTGATLGRITERGASYRDVLLDADRQQVCLTRAMQLDLGAVAKGLAVDLAHGALASFDGVMIDAGGDVRVSGVNPTGGPWKIGIRHPMVPGALIESLEVTDGAVCTSGRYERGDHLIDAREVLSPRYTEECPGSEIVERPTPPPVDHLMSTTVVAPTALAADALSTAAFALGLRDGMRFLESAGVESLLITSAMDKHHVAALPVGHV